MAERLWAGDKDLKIVLDDTGAIVVDGPKGARAVGVADVLRDMFMLRARDDQSTPSPMPTPSHVHEMRLWANYIGLSNVDALLKNVQTMPPADGHILVDDMTSESTRCILSFVPLDGGDFLCTRMLVTRPMRSRLLHDIECVRTRASCGDDGYSLCFANGNILRAEYTNDDYVVITEEDPSDAGTTEFLLPPIPSGSPLPTVKNLRSVIVRIYPASTIKGVDKTHAPQFEAEDTVLEVESVTERD
jgi:hypothetical protein